MIVHKEKIIKHFNLKKTGSKTWYSGKCPFCGRDKFGISFDSIYKGKKVSSYNCFSGKCGEKGSLYKLLKHVGRLDLINIDRTFDTKKPIKSNLVKEIEKIDCTTLIRKPPLGWKRIYQDEYLESRGFTIEQFKQYPVGLTKLEPALRDYRVFLIKNDGEIKGYIGRTNKSKEWIEEYNNQHEKKYFKYRNSSNTPFEKLLFGYDEIIQGETQTLILVEGITDKFNIDRLLQLSEDNMMKCICTFGKKISSVQIEKIKNKRVSNIVLLYDNDAIKESKRYAMELTIHFKVKVGFIYIDKDPGELNLNELAEVLSKVVDPLNFSISKINKKKR